MEQEFDNQRFTLSLSTGVGEYKPDPAEQAEAQVAAYREARHKAEAFVSDAGLAITELISGSQTATNYVDPHDLYGEAVAMMSFDQDGTPDGSSFDQELRDSARRVKVNYRVKFSTGAAAS
jgi:uncharacterized protein YggE